MGRTSIIALQVEYSPLARTVEGETSTVYPPLAQSDVRY